MTFDLVRLAFHEVDPSPGFPGWLADEGVAVAFIGGGRLYLVGLGADGELAVTDCQYGLCTALTAASAETLYLATRFQLWRLENAVPPGRLSEAGHDHLYVPQAAWTTGLLGVYDIAVDGEGRPLFANARFSCVSGPSETLNFEPRWMPPFVSTLAPENRCNLTGLAVRDGRAAFVTCSAQTDTADGWKAHRRNGGVVVEVASGAVVAGDLSMPYSPRWRDGRLWVANAGSGELGVVDTDRGRIEPVVGLPGLTRGLAFSGRYAVVGLSRPARNESFDDLPLGDRLAKSATAPVCGIAVVDVDRGECVHTLELVGAAPEVFDVAVLAGVHSAAAVSIQGDDVQELVTVPRGAGGP